jgi:hypothetical protein
MAATRAKSKKPPSPAQLAARAKFVKMVRARAAAAKKAKGGSKAKSNGTLLANRRRKANGLFSKTVYHSPRKGSSKKLTQRYYTVEPIVGGKKIGTYHIKATSEKAALRTARTLVPGRHFETGLRKYFKRNPGGLHIKGLPAKFQRMYEDIFKSSGSKGIAAATTQKAATKAGVRRKTNKRRNRTLSPAQRRSRALTRAKRQRIVAFRQHGVRGVRTRGRLPNPSPATVFTEFRGKSVTRKSKVRAATGTPSTLAKLGALKELKLRGRTLRFGGGASLAADGRKRLHVVGTRMKVRGNPGGEVDVGEIISVTYCADKPHIEAGTFNYVHKFGEEGGVRPHLIVDPEGYPIIEGGSYGITADGIID